MNTHQWLSVALALVESTVLAWLGLALLGLLRVHAPAIRLRWCQVLLPASLLLPWIMPALAFALVGTHPDGYPSGVVRYFDALTVVGPGTVDADGALPQTWLWYASWTMAVVWCGGALLRAAWLATGLVRMRAWRHGASPLCDPALDRARALVAVTAQAFSSNAVVQPISWGLRRPVILVPDALASRPPSQREAVYVHELLHVARRDIVSVWAEEVLRTVLWPHPAVWLLVPRLRLAREQVVDRETIRRTASRHAYVDVLVWCASHAAPRVSPVLPFFRRHQLLTRVASLTREDAMSRIRVIVTVLVLSIALTAGATLMAAVAPVAPGGQLPIATEGPGPIEQRAVVPTLDAPAPRRVLDFTPEWPAAARDAGLSGRFRMHIVIDEAGTVVESRVIAGSGVQRADSAVEALSATRAMRASARDAVRQWRFDPPSVAPMLIVADVTVGEPAPAVAGDAPVRVGGNIAPPRKVLDVKPEYPPVAIAARVTGVVIIETTIERTGDVSDVRVLRSVPLLDQAAIEAVRQWKYEPRNERLTLTTTVNFTLADDTPQQGAER